jgi:hypothetical protein
MGEISTIGISRSTFSSSTGLMEPGRLFCADGCAGAGSRDRPAMSHGTSIPTN